MKAFQMKGITYQSYDLKTTSISLVGWNLAGCSTSYDENIKIYKTDMELATQLTKIYLLFKPKPNY